MKLEDINNGVIIVENNKKNILNKLSNKLRNIKVITLTELKKKYYFDYTNEAIYEVCKKYNVIKEVAQKYIDNLYYIKDINEPKIEFLKEIKSFLEDKNLLIKNDLFKDYLKTQKVYFYNLGEIDKFYQNIFDELNIEVNIINEEYTSSIKKIYKANNMEEEIEFVASKICELIKSGIEINKIKLVNVQNDYIFKINKTFKLFNIPVELPNNEYIKGTIIVKKFKELFSNNIKETLENLKEFIKSKEDEKIYKKILDVLNSYAWTNDYRSVQEMVFKEIDLIKKDNIKYKNAVRVADVKDIFENDEYVFMLNFNEGIIPTNYKDEDYLSDKIKEKLKLSTSYDLNKKSTIEIQNIIKFTPNLIVTYSTHNLTNEIYISNAYNPSLFDEENIKISFNHSHNYNKLKLISEKDENKKFGTITERLLILNKYYNEIEYLTYDNSFKGIDKDRLYEYLKKKLTLSYTSMNTYYQCGYRYYLDNVLKLNKFEDSFEIVIGNIFHKILSECFQEDNYDFDLAWNREVKNTIYNFSNSEKYFLNKLKNELILVIETIQNQLKYTRLNKTMYEKEIIIQINESLNVSFKGFIDKILYDDIKGETIVAIIDYKTGNPILNINNSLYGLEMQLPIYIYLMKKSNEFKNVRIGGFYLQKILNNISNKEKRIESLKLQGYSNSDTEILEKVDSSYMDSSVIKSLKTGNNGFYAYSKVINDEEINILSSIVENKIDEAYKNILDGKFDINPKEISNKLIGCTFCKYKDICYMKPKDVVTLKEIKNVLEEVRENAIMD